MTLPSKSTGHDFDAKPRTGDVLVEAEKETRFSSLFLSPRVTEGLASAGFVRPSPIQLKAIPLGRCGLDMIVQAKSGTGKTCVFAVVALEGLLSSMASSAPSNGHQSVDLNENSAAASEARLQALILAPTREIAMQIRDVIVAIAKTSMPEIKTHAFIGGLSTKDDVAKLRGGGGGGDAGGAGGPHIVVGTPGRVKALIECGAMTTEAVRLFVLDEADKLFDDSFNEDINWIYSHLPDNKQVLALSATYPEYMAQSLQLYMRNPTFCRLDAHQPVLIGLRQFFHLIPSKPSPGLTLQAKTQALVDVISHVVFNQCLVFSNLQSQAQHLATLLSAKGWPTAHISGSQEQQTRLFAISRLKQMQIRVLVTTDLTARGIDAENVNLIVNLDVPADPETYLHRIGRAGRFGSYGVAVTLVSQGNEERNLLRIMNEYQMPLMPLPEADGGGLPPHDLLTNADYWLREDLDDQLEKMRLGEKCRGFVATKPATAVASTATRKKNRDDGKPPEQSLEIVAEEMNGEVGDDRHRRRRECKADSPGVERAKGKENRPAKPKTSIEERHRLEEKPKTSPLAPDAGENDSVPICHDRRDESNVAERTVGPSPPAKPSRLPKLVSNRDSTSPKPFPTMEELRSRREAYVLANEGRSAEEKREELRKLVDESFAAGKARLDCSKADWEELRQRVERFCKDPSMKWSPMRIRPTESVASKMASREPEGPSRSVDRGAPSEEASKSVVASTDTNGVDARSMDPRSTLGALPTSFSQGSVPAPLLAQTRWKGRETRVAGVRVQGKGPFQAVAEEEESGEGENVGKLSIPVDRMREELSSEDTSFEYDSETEYDSEYDSESGTESDKECDSEYDAETGTDTSSETTSQSSGAEYGAGGNPFSIAPPYYPYGAPPLTYGFPYTAHPAPGFYGMPPAYGMAPLYGMANVPFGFPPHLNAVSSFAYGVPPSYGMAPYPHYPPSAPPSSETHQRQYVKFQAEFAKQRSFIENAVKAHKRLSRGH